MLPMHLRLQSGDELSIFFVSGEAGRRSAPGSPRCCSAPTTSSSSRSIRHQSSRASSASSRAGPRLSAARPRRRAVEHLRLTMRESEGLDLLVAGLRQKEIALKLSISPKTVGNSTSRTSSARSKFTAGRSSSPARTPSGSSRSRSRRQGVRRRSVVAPSTSAARSRRRRPGRRERGGRRVVPGRPGQSVVGVGQRAARRRATRARPPSRRAGQEAAEQDLGQDEGGHELHCLELGLCERAEEEAERHPEQRVSRREHHDEPRRAAVSRPSAPKATSDVSVACRTASAANAIAVAEQQVELGERQRHQALERPGRPLAQHRDRRDQEHRDEREEPDHRRPTRSKSPPGRRRRLEERQRAGRHDEDERQRARVAANLPEHAPGRGESDADGSRAPPPARETPRSMSARRSLPQLSGVPGRRPPSRIRRRSSQRSASSITWLETSSVAPASASP